MRLIDADALAYMVASSGDADFINKVTRLMIKASSINIICCQECKHRPIKEDADGENYGFNIIEPNDGDERCPCLVSDGWYSWMPEDDFYCGYGERKDNE